jgi:hypothetical protein
MADMQKKMAAALAAVNAYLQMEEAAAAQHTQAQASVPAAQQSCWSQSGRQDMMTMRRLIQLRTFSSSR